ncbi:MAG: potassium transporter TrkG [Ignavibacteriaceae bacterium]
MLPVSSASGQFTPFLDALFTSASAVTTTGLVVVDTGTFYNVFGQTVIMILFQVGGLGYMIFVALAVLGFGKELSMSYRILLRESINRPSKIELIRFVKLMLYFTLIIEGIGIVILTFYFLNFYSFGEAFFSAVFHSISAFTTAGFSIYGDSFMQFKNSLVLNGIIIGLIIFGAAGFFVLYDIYVFVKPGARSKRRLSTHTKLILALAILLNLTGIIIIFFSEGEKFASGFNERMITSVFQSLSASTTAGFNSIDIGLLSVPSMFYIILLMFIGAGSGSTAGGIKLTTLAVILFSLYSQLSIKKSISVFKRSITDETVKRALAIALLTGMWAFIAVLLLTITEKSDFIKIVFEVISALGTVGLSAGITAELSSFAKILIIITMLIGRIGPLAIGLSVVKKERVAIRYAEDEILVG